MAAGDAAIIAFGVLALPVHFIKTRTHFRSPIGLLGIPLGLLLGAIAVVVVALVSGLIVTGVDLVLGIPIE